MKVSKESVDAPLIEPCILDSLGCNTMPMHFPVPVRNGAIFDVTKALGED